MGTHPSFVRAVLLAGLLFALLLLFPPQTLSATGGGVVKTHSGGSSAFNGGSPAWEVLGEDFRQVRVFINVYRSHERALDMVAEMLTSDLIALNFSIVVMCNWHELSFPDIEPFKSHKKSLVVIPNAPRSPRAWMGLTARNWNLGLVRGFHDLKKPLADVVVLCHGDLYLRPNWAVELHKRMTEPNGLVFLTQTMGDGFMAITPLGVQYIGMFDENFSDGGYHEGDYFLRAIAWAPPDRVSITDRHHERFHNSHLWTGQSIVMGDGLGDSYAAGGRIPTVDPVRYSQYYWRAKWGDRDPSSWPRDTSYARAIEKPLCPIYYLYPFFEQGLFEHSRRGYLHDPIDHALWTF